MLVPHDAGECDGLCDLRVAGQVCGGFAASDGGGFGQCAGASLEVVCVASCDLGEAGFVCVLFASVFAATQHRGDSVASFEVQLAEGGGLCGQGDAVLPRLASIGGGRDVA